MDKGKWKEKTRETHIVNDKLAENGYAQCPFFFKEMSTNTKTKGRKYKVYCEGCTLSFPDKVARRMFVYNLCAHPENYKNCMMYKALYDYYNRLYNERSK